MLRNLPTNIKRGALIAVVLIVILIGYGIYKQITTAGEVAITVTVAPSDAVVKVDNKYVSLGTIYLKPGKSYPVSVSKDGFEPYTGTQYINSTNDNISVALSPVSDAAQKWVQDNRSQYSNVEAQAGARENTTGQEFTNKNPITANLPLDNMVYTIGYKADPSDPTHMSIILTVDAAEGYRNGAIQGIRNLGYDPSQYKIEFSDYQNPFASL